MQPVLYGITAAATSADKHRLGHDILASKVFSPTIINTIEA
ncbi:MAG: hypothetical protein VKL59_12060 [Nostocaceae cyanobacterium]|nr:hypothetical protein [Nostocaceae cyanobacterium]